MDLTSGYPFWQVRDGLPAVYPALDRHLEADVAIVGGGVTGALIASHLVEAGFATVLVDRREIGWGSTAATTALLQYELDTSLAELTASVGAGRAARVYRACHGALASLHALAARTPDGSDFVRRPSLYLASTRQDAAAFEREWALRREIGLNVDLLSRAELGAQFGIERPAALFTHDAGEVDPYRLTHALLRAAAGRSLAVHDRTAVRLPVSRTRGRFRLTTDAGYRIAARELVLACGYETQVLLPQRGVTLRSTYAFASEPLKPAAFWPRRALIWESARPYLYLRTTDDDRVIVGGEDVGFSSARARDRLLRPKTATLQRRARRLLPRLPLEPAFAWTGTFAETEDGLPFIGVHPRSRGAQVACCYGGNGLLFGILAAEIITATVRGDRHPDAELFSFERPTARPPAPRPRAPRARRR
jgi:glycine/D-amino acid oxidase-like deaminating enzyme